MKRSNPTRRATFEFTIMYFDLMGIWYTTETFKWDAPLRDSGQAPYMPDVKSHIKGLRDQGGPGALPGLAEEGWNGYIIIDCVEGYPILLLPRDS